MVSFNRGFAFYITWTIVKGSLRQQVLLGLIKNTRLLNSVARRE